MLKSRFNDDSLIEIGIDEAGRGCLWGPLMAGAVVWPLESNWDDTIRNISMKIKDSKKISATKREKLADEIKEYALYSGTGFVTASEVDSLGATKGNQLAFRRALDSIQFSEKINLTVKSDRIIHYCKSNKSSGKYLYSFFIGISKSHAGVSLSSVNLTYHKIYY